MDIEACGSVVQPWHAGKEADCSVACRSGDDKSRDPLSRLLLV